jgi:hypothetical protein
MRKEGAGSEDEVLQDIELGSSFIPKDKPSIFKSIAVLRSRTYMLVAVDIAREVYRQGYRLIDSEPINSSHLLSTVYNESLDQEL